VEDVRLVLLGVFVDLRVAVSAELGIGLEQVVDVAEDLLVLVLGTIFGLVLTGVGARGDFASLLDVADVEEDAGVPE
jgi:hypothetical protein